MSNMKVHHGELYVEAMQSADWSQSPASQQRKQFDEKAERKRQDQERSRQLQRNRQSMIGPHPANRTATCGIMGHHDSTKPPPRRVPDSLIAKRAVLESEFEAKMDVAKRDAERRAVKKAMRNEQQFEERFAEFAARNREIAEQAITHNEEAKVRDRKRERLYQEWMTNIFLPTQTEIHKHVESIDTMAMMRMRNEQFERYLDECNKRTAKKGQKGAGVYLDNAKDSGYDPHVLNGHCTIVYPVPNIGKDPLKNRQTRETVGKKDAGPLTRQGEFDPTLLASGRLNNTGERPNPLLLTTGEHNLLPSLAGGSHSARALVPTLLRPKPATNEAFRFSANTTLLSNPQYTLGKPLVSRDVEVDVKQWATMEATPHGRYGDSKKSHIPPPGSNKRFMRSDVIMDHFSVPTGTVGDQLARAEMQQGGRGKRVVISDRPPQQEGAPYATDI